MKSDKLEIAFQQYDNFQELEGADRHLFEKAIEARQAAYAPYSNFRVGAAVLLKNGKIYTGNNQENIAYPSGLCAERVALFAASANEPGVAIKAIAIAAAATDATVDSVLTPCGACRQVMAEYEELHQSSIRIIVGSVADKVLVIEDVRGLLPFMFFDRGLRKG